MQMPMQYRRIRLGRQTVLERILGVPGKLLRPGHQQNTGRGVIQLMTRSMLLRLWYPRWEYMQRLDTIQYGIVRSIHTAAVVAVDRGILGNRRQQ